MSQTDPELVEMLDYLTGVGMRLHEIAEEVGVSQPTVTRWRKQSIPNSQIMDRVRALVRRRQGLTDKSGTLTYTGRIRVRGSVDVRGDVQWLDAADEQDITSNISLPSGAIGFICREPMASGRLRANELIVVGAAVPPASLIDEEAVVTIRDGDEVRSLFASLHEGRSSGSFFLMQGHHQLWDRQVEAAYPLLAILDPRAWSRSL